MIGRQVERLRRAKRLDRLIVATSSDASDDELAAYCAELKLDVFRGSRDDVLDRFCGALRRFPDADTVVRLTADCPLADPELIDQVVAHHQEAGADYTSNVLGARTYPKGLDVEVIRAQVLLDAGERASDEFEREHVTPYIYRRRDDYRVAGVARHESLAKLRWTVDLPSDLEFVRGVYATLYPQKPAFTTQDILRLPVNSAPPVE
jgi:spore coat polysaccharide biosynthesis protein SpsF